MASSSSRTSPIYTCCHRFLGMVLKILNFLQTLVGLSIIVYSAYMLHQWDKHTHSSPSPYYPDAVFSNFADDGISGLHHTLKLNPQNLPAPWFIYSFMGMGVMVCCITCIGHIAAEAINGCCLCFYALFTTVLVLLEAAFVAFIALNHRWNKDLPFDPTGELDNLRAFIEDNAYVCKWVGISVLIIQALSLFLAMIMRAMVSTQREDHEIEGRTWEPLLNPQSTITPGSIKDKGKGPHSDIQSPHKRVKFGLNSGDAEYKILNRNASTEIL